VSGEVRAAQRGFTLVEIMIALVLFSFAVAAILSVAVSMTRAFREQRRIVSTENSVRAAMDFLVDAVRGASPGVPNGIIVDASTCRGPASLGSVAGTGAIFFVDNTDAPDELEIVYASGGVVSTTHSPFESDSTFIKIPEAHVDYFGAGDYVVVATGTKGILVKVTGPASGTSLPIEPPNAGCANTFDTTYPAGSVLVRAMRAHFTVAPDPETGVPTLWMDPDGPEGVDPAEPLAEGIEDMQIAVGLQTAGAGIEWIGTTAGYTVPPGSVRAIRIALVGRDPRPLLGSAVSARPPSLNRPAGAADNFRRRVLTSVVEIRNLTGSP
jgi:prepilin-type N-terminal cleavage/methylation domain-containing protein